MRRILLAALLAMPALVSFDSASLAQGINSSPRTIDVSGHGDSSAKPDMMTLSFTVTARSDSADECTRRQSETLRQVIDALQAKLGDSAKVTTSDFSFSPPMEYGDAMSTPAETGASETWRFNGEVDAYTVSIDPTADLVETGMAAGATSVAQSGVQELPESWFPSAAVVSPEMSKTIGTNPRMVRMYPLGPFCRDCGGIAGRRNAEGNRPYEASGDRA